MFLTAILFHQKLIFWCRNRNFKKVEVANSAHINQRCWEHTLFDDFDLKLIVSDWNSILVFEYLQQKSVEKVVLFVNPNYVVPVWLFVVFVFIITSAFVIAIFFFFFFFWLGHFRGIFFLCQNALLTLLITFAVRLLKNLIEWFISELGENEHFYLIHMDSHIQFFFFNAIN